MYRVNNNINSDHSQKEQRGNCLMIDKIRLLDALHDIEDCFRTLTGIILNGLCEPTVPVCDEAPSLYGYTRDTGHPYQSD